MTGKKFANVFVFFVVLAIVAVARPLVVLADPGPAVVLQTDWGEVEIFLNTPDEFETAFFDAGDFTNLTNQTKLDMALVGGLKQALKGNDADVLISPDKRHATLTNGQQVYWGMWLKDGAIGKVDAVTIVMRTTPKWGYPDIIRNGFSIAYTEPIGTGVGVGNTDIRTDSTFGKAFQVFNLPASRVTYFSFKARVCSGGVLTEFSPHFFKGPSITDVTPDQITCCCHETHELLLPVPKCWFSTWQYRWCNQNDMARMSYFLKCFRQKLYCRTLAVTDEIAKAQCTDPQATVEITIKGDHLPRITLAEARENVHITPVDNPAITDEVRIEEVISSTHDALTLRVKILKCNPGKKQVTINGVGGMATTTFNKVITVAPDVLTREKVFNAVRIDGSREQLPVTMNLDGDVMSFAPAVWQTISPTPSTEVSPTAMTATSTGSNGNVVIGTAQAGDKAEDATVGTTVANEPGCIEPQKVWSIDLVGMPLKNEGTWNDIFAQPFEVKDNKNRRDLSPKDEDDNSDDNTHDGDKDGAPKPSETEPGLYVGLNADDDNKNGIQDMSEQIGGNDEDDLQRVELRVQNAPAGAEVIFGIVRASPDFGPGNRGRIKVWKSRSKEPQGLIMDGSSGNFFGGALPVSSGNIPLWIEGVELSNAPRDVVLIVDKVDHIGTSEIYANVDTIDITVIGPTVQRLHDPSVAARTTYGVVIRPNDALIAKPEDVRKRTNERLHAYVYSSPFSGGKKTSLEADIFSYDLKGKYWQDGKDGAYTGEVERFLASSGEVGPVKLPTRIDREFLTSSSGGFYLVKDKRLYLGDEPATVVAEISGRVIVRLFKDLSPSTGIRPPGWLIGGAGVILKDARSGKEVNADDYVYITADAEMPKLQAIFVPDIGKNIMYRFTISFNRMNRNDSDTYPSANPKELRTGQVWNILNDMGADVRGGEAILTFGSVGITEGEIKFHIRGTNPVDTAVETIIGTSPWYAIYVAKYESKQADAPAGKRYYNQFNEIGAFNQGANDVKLTPNMNTSGDGGAGIFQLTHVGTEARSPSKQELWSWKANVDTGKSEIARHQEYANVWMNAPVGTPGREKGGQRVQAQNAMGNPVPVPNETLGNVTFSDGTARVIEDAVAMKSYNGRSLGNYVEWDIANRVWKFNRENADHVNYVQRVCAEVP